MKPRLFGLVFGALTSVLGACDRPPPPAPDPWASPADGKGVATVLEYRLDVEAARRRGSIPPGLSDSALREETLAILRSRVGALGYSESRVNSQGSDLLTISLPAGVGRAWVQGTLLAVGDLKFRIEVDPTPDRQDQAASLWDKTPAEFDQYKEKEIAHWKKARDHAEPYKPVERKDMRVVRKARASGETPDDFAVVLEPEGTDDRFGGETITNVAPSTDFHGMPAVSFSVKTDYQGIFGAWTGKHLKQPMAIILNDEFQQAPVIQSKLTDNVEITLGARDVPSAKEKQREWLAWLGSGALRVPLVFVSSSDHPPPR